jgi:hypothetical protein
MEVFDSQGSHLSQYPITLMEKKKRFVPVSSLLIVSYKATTKTL